MCPPDSGWLKGHQSPSEAPFFILESSIFMMYIDFAGNLNLHTPLSFLDTLSHDLLSFSVPCLFITPEHTRRMYVAHDRSICPSHSATEYPIMS